MQLSDDDDSSENDAEPALLAASTEHAAKKRRGQGKVATARARGSAECMWTRSFLCCTSLLVLAWTIWSLATRAAADSTAATSSAAAALSRCAAMHLHAESYKRLRKARVWEELRCAHPLGFRPRAHTAEHMGTPCEAWIHRGIQFVLSRLLSTSDHALEWSTGSSSRYYLFWIASLHSIEHDAAWAEEAERRIRADLPAEMVRRWRLDVIRNSSAYRLVRGHDEPHSAFAAYVDVNLKRASYDFVSVGGRARSACLRRVWHEQLVKPGGLLLLDNSVRPPYRKARRLFDVSPNWTSVEFSSAGQGKALDELASVLWCRLR